MNVRFHIQNQLHGWPPFTRRTKQDFMGILSSFYATLVAHLNLHEAFQDIHPYVGPEQAREVIFPDRDACLDATVLCLASAEDIRAVYHDAEELLSPLDSRAWFDALGEDRDRDDAADRAALPRLIVVCDDARTMQALCEAQAAAQTAEFLGPDESLYLSVLARRFIQEALRIKEFYEHTGGLGPAQAEHYQDELGVDFKDLVSGGNIRDIACRPGQPTPSYVAMLEQEVRTRTQAKQILADCLARSAMREAFEQGVARMQSAVPAQEAPSLRPAP